jgi:hypothetical protein
LKSTQNPSRRGRPKKEKGDVSPLYEQESSDSTQLSAESTGIEESSPPDFNNNPIKEALKNDIALSNKSLGTQIDEEEDSKKSPREGSSFEDFLESIQPRFHQDLIHPEDLVTKFPFKQNNHQIYLGIDLQPMAKT